MRPRNRHYRPKHRRCTRARHHVWDVRNRRGIYGITKCLNCGDTEMFW